VKFSNTGNVISQRSFALHDVEIQPVPTSYVPSVPPRSSSASDPFVLHCRSSLGIVTSAAFTAAEVNKIFSGYRPCQLAKVTDVSRTICALTSDPSDWDRDAP
jgi:hypothetical protein